MTETEPRKASGSRERDTWGGGGGGGHEEFGRGIKRVLIQLRKIYDPMRMWL